MRSLIAWQGNQMKSNTRTQHANLQQNKPLRSFVPPLGEHGKTFFLKLVNQQLRKSIETLVLIALIISRACLAPWSDQFIGTLFRTQRTQYLNVVKHIIASARFLSSADHKFETYSHNMVSRNLITPIIKMSALKRKQYKSQYLFRHSKMFQSYFL